MEIKMRDIACVLKLLQKKYKSLNKPYYICNLMKNIMKIGDIDHNHLMTQGGYYYYIFESDSDV
jgi:hypothetical protein